MEESEWEYVPVAQDRYPFLITFPYFEAPGALTVVEESAVPSHLIGATAISPNRGHAAG